MILSDDYGLSYYPNENLIVINLPQTMRTAINTVSPICNRRVDIKESDLVCLLTITQLIFAPKQGVDDG
jgi:hypothetical protein